MWLGPFPTVANASYSVLSVSLCTLFTGRTCRSGAARWADLPLVQEVDAAVEDCGLRALVVRPREPLDFARYRATGLTLSVSIGGGGRVR